MASPFILASNSPRRRALLAEAGYEFEVIAPTVSETASTHLSLRELTIVNATRKGLAVSRLHPRRIVLAADTLVALEGEVIGKPRDPNHARAHYNLGTLLAARGERKEGIEHLETAVRLDPEGKGARFNLATALMEAGEPARALAQYDEIIRRTPADAMAHYQRGLALLALQKPEEALGELQAVAEAAPGAVEPQVGLARALAALGRFPEAAAAQGRAVELAEKGGRPDAEALRACLARYQAGRGCP